MTNPTGVLDLVRAGAAAVEETKDHDRAECLFPFMVKDYPAPGCEACLRAEKYEAIQALPLVEALEAVLGEANPNWDDWTETDDRLLGDTPVGKGRKVLADLQEQLQEKAGA